MEGCLLIGGKGPDRSFLGPRIAACSLIIAADSGLKHAKELGLEPSEIVGDFDSVAQHDLDRFPDIRTHRYNRDKGPARIWAQTNLRQQTGGYPVWNVILCHGHSTARPKCLGDTHPSPR